MTAMFDTLKFARALREGGSFTPEQSERLSDALSDAISGEVAAKADLDGVESKLGRKIDDLEGKLDRRIDDLEGKLDRRIDDLEGKLDRGLKEVRADVRAEIKGVQADIKGVQAEIKGVEGKIDAAKADTIKWVVGIVGFQSVAIIGAAIVLARILSR